MCLWWLRYEQQAVLILMIVGAATLPNSSMGLRLRSFAEGLRWAERLPTGLRLRPRTSAWAERLPAGAGKGLQHCHIARGAAKTFALTVARASEPASNKLY